VGTHKTTTLGDPELVAAIRSGQPAAPRVLWMRYAPMAFRILRRKFGQGDVVDDLAQEVFLNVFRKLPELRQPQALKAFIISTTVLTARQELRRRRIRDRAATLDDRVSTAPDSVPRAFDAREALHRFTRLLFRLNTRDRQAFVCRFIEGKELLQVAAAMQISVATAKRRIARSSARIAFLAQRDPLLVEYAPASPDEVHAAVHEVHALHLAAPERVLRVKVLPDESDGRADVVRDRPAQSQAVLDHAVLVKNVVVGLLDHGDTGARRQIERTG